MQPSEVFLAGWEACDRKWEGPSAAGHPTNPEAALELFEMNRLREWPISTDGPHPITQNRLWLARQLMDSKNSDEEAYGIVAHSPAICDLR